MLMIRNDNDAKNKWDDVERGFCENTGTGQDMWQCHIQKEISISGIYSPAKKAGV
jgi:hypothetical protein